MSLPHLLQHYPNGDSGLDSLEVSTGVPNGRDGGDEKKGKEGQEAGGAQRSRDLKRGNTLTTGRTVADSGLAIP